jgi:hypothetical protein
MKWLDHPDVEPNSACAEIKKRAQLPKAMEFSSNADTCFDETSLTGSCLQVKKARPAAGRRQGFFQTWVDFKP